jgi:hypothetical protein
MTFANISRLADRMAHYAIPTTDNGLSAMDPPTTGEPTTPQTISRGSYGSTIPLSASGSSSAGFVPSLSQVQVLERTRFGQDVNEKNSVVGSIMSAQPQQFIPRGVPTHVNSRFNSGFPIQISSHEFDPPPSDRIQNPAARNTTAPPKTHPTGSGARPHLDLDTFLGSLPNLATLWPTSHVAGRVDPPLPSSFIKGPPSQPSPSTTMPNAALIQLNTRVSIPPPPAEKSLNKLIEESAVSNTKLASRLNDPVPLSSRIHNSPSPPDGRPTYSESNLPKGPRHSSYGSTHEETPVRREMYNSYRPGGSKDCDTPGKGYDSYRPGRSSHSRRDSREPEKKREAQKPHEQSRRDLRKYDDDNTPDKTSRDAAFTSTPTPNKAPTAAASTRVTPLSLSERLQAKLELECTLKITARNESSKSLKSLNLRTLFRALKPPNILQLEFRPNQGLLYLRLADSTTAHRIATGYRQYNKNGHLTSAEQNILEAIKVSSPSDFAPEVKEHVVLAYRAGARRCLGAWGVKGTREGERIVEAAKKLWGFWDEGGGTNNADGGVLVIAFEGVESAVEGRKILGNKFGDVKWEFMDDKF